MRWWLLLPAVLLVAFIACDEWPGLGDGDGGPPAASRMEDNSGRLGSSCGSTVTCNQGLTCLTTAPGGLCTKLCASDADCSGGSCLMAWGGLYCFTTCSSDLMCRSSYSCLSTGMAYVCAPTPATVTDK